MAFFPRLQLTKSLLTNARCLIPLAVMYAILLITSWTPESASLLLPGDMKTALSEMMAGKPGLYFVPTIGGICKLLSAPMASVSAWAHLQFIAFFCARYIWMDGTHPFPLLHSTEWLFRALNGSNGLLKQRIAYWLLQLRHNHP
jgi:Domain of unknown function (DUF4281)